MVLSLDMAVQLQLFHITDFLTDSAVSVMLGMDQWLMQATYALAQ